MNNPAIICNVNECVHNCNSHSCCLSTVEISHEKTQANAVAVPHFCKSFCSK